MDNFASLRNHAYSGDRQRITGNILPTVVVWDIDSFEPATDLFKTQHDFFNFLNSHLSKEGFTGEIKFDAFGWFKDEISGWFNQKGNSSCNISYNETKNEDKDKEKDKEKDKDKATYECMDVFLKTKKARGFNIVALTGNTKIKLFDILLNAKRRLGGALVLIALSRPRCATIYESSCDVDLVRYFQDPDSMMDLKRIRLKEVEPSSRSKKKAEKRERDKIAKERLRNKNTD